MRPRLADVWEGGRRRRRSLSGVLVSQVGKAETRVGGGGDILYRALSNCPSVDILGRVKGEKNRFIGRVWLCLQGDFGIYFDSTRILSTYMAKLFYCFMGYKNATR